MGLGSIVGSVLGGALGSFIAPGVGTSIGAGIGGSLGGAVDSKSSADKKAKAANSLDLIGGINPEYLLATRQGNLIPALQKQANTSAQDFQIPSMSPGMMDSITSLLKKQQTPSTIMTQSSMNNALQPSMNGALPGGLLNDYWTKNAMQAGSQTPFMQSVLPSLMGGGM